VDISSPVAAYVQGGCQFEYDIYLVELPTGDINDSYNFLPNPGNINILSFRNAPGEEKVDLAKCPDGPQTGVSPPDATCATEVVESSIVIGVLYRLFDKNGSIIKTNDEKKFTVEFKSPCIADTIQASSASGSSGDKTTFVTSGATDVTYYVDKAEAVRHEFVFTFEHDNSDFDLCDAQFYTDDTFITDCTLNEDGFTFTEFSYAII
jgi:hypothetical protein